MKDVKFIGYSPICILGTSEWLYKKDGRWAFDVEGWKQHLAPLLNAGANAIRILAYSVFGERKSRGDQFSPFILDKPTNKWDLSKRDPEFFPILKQAIRGAIELAPDNMTAWLCILDGCENQDNKPWNEYSPWMRNIQKVASIYDDRAGEDIQAFFEDCATELQEFAPHMAYHLANEANKVAFSNQAKKYMFPVIKKFNLPFNRLGYGSTMDDRDYLGAGKYADKPDTVQDITRKLFSVVFGDPAKVQAFREVHGIGNRLDKDRPFGDRIAQAICWWSKDKQSELALLGPVIYDTDGMKKGDSKCDKDFDGARPSAETMGEIARYAWQGAGVDNVHLFHCPQTYDTDCLSLTFEAISESYKKVFGKYPYNHGKVHCDPPAPPDPPDPPTPPIPPEPPTPGTKFPWLIAAAVAALAILAALIFF